MAWYEETFPTRQWASAMEPGDVGGLTAALPGQIAAYGVRLKEERRKWVELQAQIQDYEEMKRQFWGPEATYIRWLIDGKIGELRRKLEKSSATSSELWARQEMAMVAEGRLTAEEESRRQIEEREWASALEPGQERMYPVPGGLERQARLERARGVLAEEWGEWGEMEPPPVPDWLTPYLETTMPTGAAFQLRPLGAQEELGVEKLGHMAGYLGWEKAGAPTKYSPEAIESMADYGKWWEEYIRQSQKLFPTRARLGARWAIRR